MPCSGCALPLALDLKLEPALVGCECALHLLAAAALLHADGAVADTHVTDLKHLSEHHARPAATGEPDSGQNI